MQRNYKQGVDRQQGQLLPPRVEDYVSETNPVRAIDVYVESLDLVRLGFGNTVGGLTPGQPAYPPRALLKLYLYGFLQGVRSSRKLAQECQRNLEAIWLLAGLTPSYKTIADFRKNNLAAIKAVNRDFVQVCHELDLFSKELVGIDSSYFRGNVGKKSIYTKQQLEKLLVRIDKHIQAYLTEMDECDTAEAGEMEQVQQLQHKLIKLRERQEKHQARLAQLEAQGTKQVAEVDPDARLLVKPGQSVAGYSVQTAVDEKHKLLVACEVTQAGNDTQQLAPMGHAAAQSLGVDSLVVVADAGYYDHAQIKTCEDTGITAYVPEPNKKARNARRGKYTRDDFKYQPETDSYLCPAGITIMCSGGSRQRGKEYFAYRSQPSLCRTCALKAHCLPKIKKYRSIFRWEHEDDLESYRQRIAQDGKAKQRVRACLVEHPFGTLKRWCGWDQFLLRGLEKVGAEFELWMLGYNFKRVLNIIGLQAFQQYCLSRG